jgi:hypothetical protein
VSRKTNRRAVLTHALIDSVMINKFMGLQGLMSRISLSNLNENHHLNACSASGFEYLKTHHGQSPPISTPSSPLPCETSS